MQLNDKHKQGWYFDKLSWYVFSSSKYVHWITSINFVTMIDLHMFYRLGLITIIVIMNIFWEHGKLLVQSTHFTSHFQYFYFRKHLIAPGIMHARMLAKLCPWGSSRGISAGPRSSLQLTAVLIYAVVLMDVGLYSLTFITITHTLMLLGWEMNTSINKLCLNKIELSSPGVLHDKMPPPNHT